MKKRMLEEGLNEERKEEERKVVEKTEGATSDEVREMGASDWRKIHHFPFFEGLLWVHWEGFPLAALTIPVWFFFIPSSLERRHIF